MIEKELTIEQEDQRLKVEEDKANKEISGVENKISYYKNFAWILIVTGLVIGILGFIVHSNGLNWKLNLFGDYVGGVVASLWSLAGLFIIYVAFLGQRIQLIQQKLELRYNQFEVRATREELKAQKEQMIEQNKTLKQQRFENTFFQMLNLHHQIVNSIDIKRINKEYKGRDAFKHIYENFKMHMENKKKDNFNLLIQVYLLYFNKHQSDLGHYFRNLYNIVKLVKNSDVGDKHRYTNLIRAQLSSYEQLLLFYNCLSEKGKDKFKPLVEEFHLLKNMPKEELIYPQDIEQYNNSAYGEIK